MKILQVVGFKNSGKTTMISRWVRLLKENGLTVAVVKHHGHASSLALPDKETDGVQFLKVVLMYRLFQGLERHNFY